jgi:hypothetical protein
MNYKFTDVAQQEVHHFGKQSCVMATDDSLNQRFALVTYIPESLNQHPTGISLANPWLKIFLFFTLGVTAKEIREEAEKEIDELAARGISSKVFYLQPNENHSVDQFILNVQANSFDWILIGTNIRKVDKHIFDFEKLLNLLIEKGNKSKIWFSQDPLVLNGKIIKWI